MSLTKNLAFVLIACVSMQVLALSPSAIRPAIGAPTAFVSSPFVRASFSEIDLYVREVVMEAIESEFASEGFSVDLDTLRYTRPVEIRLSEGQDQILIIFSEVKGEQRLMRPFEGWYDCETQLKLLSRNRYEHLTTKCVLDLI